MIPLLHDFADERVLVVGGGPVGARKARRFDAEARVVVVSADFADADFGGAELIRSSLEPGEVDDWFDRLEPALAIAATDDAALNDAVTSAARRRGILHNRADRAGADREVGSVVVPATVRDDPVCVAVATGGRAPALSRYLREELEPSIEGAGAMAEVLGGVREECKRRGVPEHDRRRIVREAARAPELWTALRSGDENHEQVIEDVLEGEASYGGERP